MENKELKTLKDLKWRSPNIKERIDLAILPSGVKPKNDWFVCEGNLKQEAIKWVKHLYNNENYNNNNLRGFAYGSIEWIKHFFNITEEDLK